MNKGQKKLVPATDKNFVEKNYLDANLDIVKAIEEGVVESGWSHFNLYGRNEGRKITEPTMIEIVTERLMPKIFRKKNIGTVQLQHKINNLTNRIADLEVLVSQQNSIMVFEADLPPLPPKHLQIRVVGSYVSNFIESGFKSVYPDINNALGTIGRKLENFHAILDFGCGCGRATRAFSKLLPDCNLHATDIDAEAITWLQANYSKFAEFSVTPHLPPTSYLDGQFDFIFGISVFTHLPEDMQNKWLIELHRLLEPGGIALMTTHGENHYSKLDVTQKNVIDSHGFLYVDSNYGESISLPDFYQTAFHSRDYIKREWGKKFIIKNIIPLGMQNHQDIVLMQKE